MDACNQPACYLPAQDLAELAQAACFQQAGSAAATQKAQTTHSLQDHNLQLGESFFPAITSLFRGVSLMHILNVCTDACTGIRNLRKTQPLGFVLGGT